MTAKKMVDIDGNAVQGDIPMSPSMVDLFSESAVESGEVGSAAQAILAAYLVDVGTGRNEFAIAASYHNKADIPVLGYLERSLHPMLARMARDQRIAGSDLSALPKDIVEILKAQRPQSAEGNFLKKLMKGGEE